MLSYQHGYHAGGYADVIKHLALTRILNYLAQKEKPFFCFDSHSGRGIYDLLDIKAAKTAEFMQGIGKLWDPTLVFPKVFDPYINKIKALNPEKLQYYPGSPCFAVDQLRSQDRLVCAEMHPREFFHLEHLSTYKKRVFFKHIDGIAGLPALLPPVERRGLVFIDPSYEVKTEYKQLPRAIKNAYGRFANGIFCLWYPIMDKYSQQQLHNGLAAIGVKSALTIEFYLTQSSKSQSEQAHASMNGCGLFIINPPYTLAKEMKTILDFLSRVFNPGTSYYHLACT